MNSCVCVCVCVPRSWNVVHDRYAEEFDAESPYYSQMVHNLLIAAVYDDDNDGSSRSNNNSENNNGDAGRGGSGSGNEEISTSDSTRSAAMRASGVSGVSGVSSARVGTNRLCMQTSRNHHADYNQWARSNWRGTLPIAFVASLFQDPRDAHGKGAGVEGAGVTGSAYHIDGDNDASCGAARRARYVYMHQSLAGCTCVRT